MLKAGRRMVLPAGPLTTASVVLHELFLTQLPDEGGFAYALPMHTSKHPLPMLPHPKPVRPIAASADRILLDFNNEMPSRIEYGHMSVSRAYENPGGRQLLGGFSSVLGKEKRRIVLDNFDFLHNLGVGTIPLRPNSAQSGLDLFSIFKEKWTSKSKVRNTLNDLFILAIAIESGSVLVSDDKLLCEFANEVAPRTLEERDDIYISSPKSTGGRTINRESKGYINSQWRAKGV